MGAKRVALGVAAGGFLLAFASSGVAEPRDEHLQRRIGARLERDTRLGQIECGVDNGVATLKGSVSTRLERARAERLARVEGIKKIDNQIEIEPEEGMESDAAGATAEEKQPTDGEITHSLRSQFTREELLRGSSISVSTDRQGVVWLTGTVPSQAARARVLEIARTTTGVRQVNNQLVIRPAHTFR